MSAELFTILVSVLMALGILSAIAIIWKKMTN